MRGTPGAVAGIRAIAAAVLAAALAAAAWAPAGPDGLYSGAQCSSGPDAAPRAPTPASSPVPPCAAAQEQRGARMSIVVTLADDLLVMGEGGVHLRGDVLVHNYDPREGHMFQEIRAEPSGRVVSKSKIFLRTGSGGEWTAQIGATLKPEDYPAGDYSIGAVTESGLRSPRAGFTVSDEPPAAKGGPPAAPPPPPPDAWPPPARDPIPDAGPSGAADAPSDAPSGLARLDAPVELPELPELPELEDVATAVLPGDGRPEESEPPVQPADAPAPPPHAPSAARPTPAPPAAPASRLPDPGRGFDLFDHLTGLLTAGYLVTIIVSVIISFVAMMLVRAAVRRIMRRRRRRAARAPRARRP